MISRPVTPITQFVELGRLTIPAEPVKLAITLEGRGFKLRLDDAGRFGVEPTGVSGPLSFDDRSEIAKWRHHLAAIVSYVAPVCCS